MDVHFVFSDDSGKYVEPPRGQNAPPFFCRVALGFSSDDWLKFREREPALRQRFGINRKAELKWSTVSRIVQHRRVGSHGVPKGAEYEPFTKVSTQDLLGFVDGSLAMVERSASRWAVLTITPNNSYVTIRTTSVLQFHVQDIMQRAQMELEQRDALGILFLDPESKKRDEFLREAYVAALEDDRFIGKYDHIKDSLAYENSHHSLGIRLADFAVGVCNGWLRGFPESTRLFKRRLLPMLRTDWRGSTPVGYGLVEVPKRPKVRAYLRQKVASL